MSTPQLLEWRRQCEAILGTSINWSLDSGGRSFLSCPWYDKHSKNGSKDSFLVMEWDAEKVINIYAHCSHTSCKSKWKDTNHFLRNQFGVPHPKPNEILRASHKAVHEIEKQRPKLIEHWRRNVRDLPGVNLNTVKILGRLFQPNDYLWIGQPEYTGGERNRAYFKTLKDWAAAPPPPWLQFICPNSLRQGCLDRKTENVLDFRYLILEMDHAEPSEQRALIEAVNFHFLPGRLEMIVFSGNQSLHSWWRHPGKDWISNNKTALAALGFDAHTFQPVQPVRIPGAVNSKTGKRQSVLWIK